MVTIIRRILFSMGVWARSLQILHGCVIFQEPEIKIEVLQLQMHRFLKPHCMYQALLFSSNRNLQSHEYMTVFEQMWQGVNQSTQEIQLQSRKETNRQGLAALWLKNVFLLPTDLPTYAPFYSDPHDAVKQRYIHMVMFLLPQFHYVTGRVGLYLLAQWKGTKQLSGIMELLASLRIQAPDRTGTKVLKLSETQWRSL